MKLGFMSGRRGVRNEQRRLRWAVASVRWALYNVGFRLQSVRVGFGFGLTPKIHKLDHCYFLFSIFL